MAWTVATATAATTTAAIASSSRMRRPTTRTSRVPPRIIFPHTNVRLGKSIPELRVIKLFDSIFHIIVVCVIHNPSSTPSIMKNLGKANIPGFSHVILKILPGCRRGQSIDYNTIFRAPGYPASTSAIAVTAVSIS